MSRNDEQNEDEGVEVSSKFFNFLILGIALIFIGIMILVVISLFFGGPVSAGIVIFIGPFPIVLGKGPDAVWLILIGIIIAILSVAFYLITYRRVRRSMRMKRKFIPLLSLLLCRNTRKGKSGLMQ